MQVFLRKRVPINTNWILMESFTDQRFPDLSYCEIAIFNVNEYNGSSNKANGNICKIRKNLYLHVENIPRFMDWAI